MTKQALFDLHKLNEERNSESPMLKTEVSKEFSFFCIWCKAYKNGVVSMQNFDEYCQNERKITPWLKNKIKSMLA